MITEALIYTGDTAEYFWTFASQNIAIYFMLVLNFLFSLQYLDSGLHHLLSVIWLNEAELLNFKTILRFI